MTAKQHGACSPSKSRPQRPGNLLSTGLEARVEHAPLQTVCSPACMMAVIAIRRGDVSSATLARAGRTVLDQLPNAPEGLSAAWWLRTEVPVRPEKRCG
jgi:hypothetical protein